MKWLRKDGNQVVKFDEYFDYINSIKNNLPATVYEFASNWKFYALNSRSSLHDCWLDRISIFEVGTGNRSEVRCVNIEISLLGAYHDRHISLKYKNVHKYSASEISFKSNSSGHGDLLFHEIRLNDKNLIEHELEFSNGNFCITFSELEYKEILKNMV